MKRDLDLCRQILLAIEESKTAQGGVPLSFSDRSADDVNFHVMLLSQAGLIEAVDCSSRAGLKWIPIRLTWAGCEFLDLARNNTLWNKAKEMGRSMVGDVTLDGLKRLLSWLSQQAIEAGLNVAGQV
jgi:hypothetical protein